MSELFHFRMNHPDHGKMLNQGASAKYLGISRKKFRRIAPPPDYVEAGQFWSKRVLDTLPLSEDFVRAEVRQRGKACGKYLIAVMDDEEIRALRAAMSGASIVGRVLCHCVLPAGLGLLARAKWHGEHCDCPRVSPQDETSLRLREYGVTISFRVGRDAGAFREGILSVIKDHVRGSISRMSHTDASRHVHDFWGGGSYEGLLLGHQRSAHAS